ncbi:MAG: DNRLRE domain-containing protein [bacterium]|nr:DNRLRE domain-containing protein [bacterium]
MRPKWVSLWMLGAALAVLNCGQEKASPVGSGLYDQENPGSENRLFVTASRDTVFTQSVSCGSGYHLFTGSHSGIETAAFFVFDTLSVDSAVTRAVLAFRAFPYAVSASGAVRLLFSETGSDWDETGLTWDSRPAETGPPFAECAVDASDTSDVEIALPLDLALSLVNPENAAGRPGVALRAGDPDCVFRLYSREAGVASSPVLLFIADGDTADTVTVQTRKDAFTVRNGTRPAEGRLRIQNGTAERILLFFDVSAIPREATINRARLILHNDAGSVFPASDPDFSFYVYPVTDSPWTVPPATLDSTRSVSGVFSSDSTAVAITSLVQRWTSGVARNGGLMLKGAMETSDPAGCAPYSRSAPDSSLIPRLELFYSLPPTSRF